MSAKGEKVYVINHSTGQVKQLINMILANWLWSQNICSKG
jgi:hypothetical protein